MEKRRSLLDRKGFEVVKDLVCFLEQRKLTMANGQHWRHRRDQTRCGLVGLSRTLKLVVGEEGMNMWLRPIKWYGI